MTIKLLAFCLCLALGAADPLTDTQQPIQPALPVESLHPSALLQSQNLTTAPAPPAPSQANVSSLGDFPPAGYQRLRRPVTKGPVDVHVGIEIEHFLGVNDAEQVTTIDFVLHLSWVDKRLKWDVKKKGIMQRRVDPAEIWMPGIDIINQREPFKVLKEAVVVKGQDGTVNVKRRIVVKLITNMDFGNFPFDSHKVTIDMESFFYNAEEVMFSKNDEKNIIDPNLDDPTWTIGSFEMTVDNPVTATDETNAQIAGVIAIHRKRTGAINNLVAPLFLIVLMALSQFYMNLYDRFDVRVGVVTTAILTIMAFQYSIMANLPKIAYLTWVQYYSLICFAFVFMCLVEVVVVHYLDHTKTYTSLIPEIEDKCRFWYPISFFTCTALMLCLGVLLA